MKTLYYYLTLTLLLASVSHAGIISHTDYTAGSVITAAGQNSNENTIVNEFNGNINSANIAASGVATSNIAANAVTYSKLDSGGEKLFGYRRPRLVYVSTSNVSIESGLDGTSGDCVILFPDGTVRTDSTASHTTLDITRVANYTSGTIQSGIYSGSVSANTWYAVYGVKNQANSTDFVAVATTVLPLQANFATLNSNLGSNSWSYLGLIRYGDQASSTTVLAPFYMVGNMTWLSNTVSRANLNAPGANNALPPGILLATTGSANSLTWTYSAGTSGQVIPNNIVIGLFGIDLASGLTITIKGVSSNSAYKTYAVGGVNENSMLDMPASDGVTILGGSASPFDILIRGWIDGALSQNSVL